MLVPHTANLITLNPLARSALQATTAALLDQASAPKQYAQLGPIHLRARIRASSALRENTAWKVALQLRVAGIVLREVTHLMAPAQRLHVLRALRANITTKLAVLQNRSAYHALLADTALKDALRGQPPQHCAVLVLREVTLLLAAAKRLIAMVE